MRTAKQAAKHCVQIYSAMDMEKYLKEYANDIIDMCASQAEYVMEPDEDSEYRSVEDGKGYSPVLMRETILQIKKSI